MNKEITTIYLNYDNGYLFLNDLREAELIRPKLNEYLYFKYLNQIKNVLNWKEESNPVVIIKIIDSSIHKVLQLQSNTIDNSKFRDDWLVSRHLRSVDKTKIINIMG